MRHKRKYFSAYTLVELLMVISIIIILLGVVVPVLRQAKLEGKRAVSTSNLRQCGIALRLYCEDYDGPESMPLGPAAVQVLKYAPTCDPNDVWRKTCSDDFGPPLIGSYAYVRFATAYSSKEAWERIVQHTPNQTVMASVFYANEVPFPLRADGVYRGPVEKYRMPDRVLRLRLDGSVGMTKQKTFVGGGHILLTWDMLFFDDDPNAERISSEAL
jgi:type II secretory pathway pseudopilin PulG